MSAGETSPVLEIRELTKSFGPVSVLKGVTFSLGSGEILGLAGENGAGKSTLAKCISSLMRPTPEPSDWAAAASWSLRSSR